MFRLDFQVNSSNASHYYLLSIARSPEDNGTYSSVMEIDTYESNGTQANEPQRFNNQVADKLLEECNTVMLQHTHKVASLALSVFIKHLMDIVERQTDDKGKPEMQEFLNEYIKGQDAWIQNLAKPDKNGAVLLLNFLDPEPFPKHPKAKMCLDFQDPVEGILKSKLKLEIDLDKEGQEIKGVTLKRIGNTNGFSIKCDRRNQWYLRYKTANLPQANHNIRDAVDKLFKVLDWIRTLKEGAPIDIPGAPEPVPAAAATGNQTAAPAAVPNMTVAAGDLNQAASALQVTTPAVATTAAIEATKPLPPVKEFFTKEVFIKTLKTESPEKEDTYYSDLWEQYQKLDPEAKEVVYNLKTEYVGRLQHCLSKGIEYAALDLQEKKLIQALYAAREQSGRKLKLLHCINFQQSYPNRISVQNYLMESLQKTNQPFNVDIDLLTGSPSAYKLTTILCQSRNVKSQEECRRCSDEAAASIQTQLLSGFALDSAQYNLAVDLWMETGKTVADLAICNSLVKEYTKLNAEQKQFITNLQTAKGQTLSACLRFVWETGKELQPSSTLGECIQNIKSGAVAAGPNLATSPAAAATTGAEEKTSWQDMLKGIRGMQSVSSFLNRADLTSLSASSKETEQAFMQNLRTHYSELPVESQRSLDVKDLTQEAQDFITTLERESPEYDRVHSLWLWLYYNQLAADAKEFINTLRQEASLKWGECIAIENKYDNLESTQKKLIQLLRAAIDKQGKKLTLLQCLHLQKTYANLIPAQKTLLESLRESNQLFNEDIQLLSYKPEMYKLLVVLWRNLNNEITLQEIIELAGVYIKNLREGFTQDSEEYNLAVNLWLETGKTVADLAICNSLVKEYTSLSSKQTKFITNLQNGTGQTLSDCLRLLLEIAKSSQKSSIAAYIDSMILKTSAMKQKLQQLIDGVKKSLLQANTSDIVLRFCNWVTNAQNAKATVQHLSYEAQSNKLINRFSFSLESTTWQLEITQSENKLDLKVNEMINGQQQNSGERMGLSIPAGFKLQMQNFALQTSHFVWDFCLQSLIKEIDRISDQGQSEETKAYLEKCKDALRKLNRDRGKSPSKLSFNPIDQKFEIIFDDKTRFWFTIRDNTSIAELTYQVDTEVRLVGNSASETKLFYGPNGESLKINTSIPAQPFLSTCNWYSKALWDNQ
jgi:hypothetical protein